MYKLNNNQANTHVYTTTSEQSRMLLSCSEPPSPELSHPLLLPRATFILTSVLTESMLFFGVLSLTFSNLQK